MNNIKSWSLSALKMYEQCALKYKFVKIDKIPEEPSRALIRGIAIHAKMEHYLKGDITGMPRELAKFETELKNLKKHKAIAEEMLVLDKNWNFLGSTKKEWMSRKAWLRAKTDARIDDLIIDLKTGRVYPDHEDQAELYSMIIMIMDETHDVIEVEFWYCDSGEVAHYTFHRVNLVSMIRKWSAKAEALFLETEWNPTINEYCKWCNFKDRCPAMANA